MKGLNPCKCGQPARLWQQVDAMTRTIETRIGCQTVGVEPTHSPIVKGSMELYEARPTQSGAEAAQDPITQWNAANPDPFERRWPKGPLNVIVALEETMATARPDHDAGVCDALRQPREAARHVQPEGTVSGAPRKKPYRSPAAACQAKERFRSLAKARAAAIKKAGRGFATGIKLYGYQCQHCDGWHLTSSPTRKTK